jgi:magnesium-transporting ATPase (P-type)
MFHRSNRIFIIGRLLNPGTPPPRGQGASQCLNATDGADFTGATGTATILAGDTQAVVSIDVLGDALVEGDEDDVMARPPRDPAAPVVSRSLVGLGLAQGGAAFAVLGSLYAGLSLAGQPAEQVRAAVFTALVCTVAAMVLANRAFSVPLSTSLRRPNAALWWVLAATAALLALTMGVPSLRALFGFASPSALPLALAGATSLALLPLLGALARRRASGTA